MRPGSHEKELPGNLFWWESPDGSRVMTFKIPNTYCCNFKNTGAGESDEVRNLRAELKMSQEQGIDFMFFYGVGNHGGGPTIANLNRIRKLQDDFGYEVLVHGSPDSYFDNMTGLKPDIPIVQDDLQHHASGCYSTHSETKSNNRKAEHRLMTAEKFASAAESMLGLSYPLDRFNKAWQNVLFNQFHDIMGGCSIREAYEDAREVYGEALNIGAEALNAALQKIAWSIDTMKPEIEALSKEMDWKSWENLDCGAPLVVFNPLSWEVKAPVQVNRNVKGITDETGIPVPVQKVRASQSNGGTDKWDTLFEAAIPALGYRVYWMYMNREFDIGGAGTLLLPEGAVLENAFIKLEIDPYTGYIQRLFDKKNGVEVFEGMGAVPVVIDEYHCDTWAHNIFEFRNEVGRFGEARLS
jgi:alpha-mannosidase